MLLRQVCIMLFQEPKCNCDQITQQIAQSQHWDIETALQKHTI